VALDLAVRPDGSRDHRILRNRQSAKRARLSPDRKWVAFIGAPPGKAPMSDFDIQLVRLDGTGLRRVTSTADWDIDAAWSPDGRWLSFTRSAPSPNGCADASIWVVRRDGSDPRHVAAGCGARWSPDGTELVYTSPDGHDFSVVDVNGGTPRLLLSPPAAAYQQAAGWSPVQKAILFTRTSDQTGRSGDVFVIAPDGTGIRKLGAGFAGAWSPGGRHVLYTRSFSSALFVMNADGSGKRRLVATLASEPDWR